MLLLQTHRPPTFSGLPCRKTGRRRNHGVGPSEGENHAGCAAQGAPDENLAFGKGVALILLITFASEDLDLCLHLNRIHRDK